MIKRPITEFGLKAFVFKVESNTNPTNVVETFPRTVFFN